MLIHGDSSNVVRADKYLDFAKLRADFLVQGDGLC